MIRDLSMRTVVCCLSASLILTALWDAALVYFIASAGLSWLL